MLRFAFFKTKPGFYCRFWLILGMVLLASPVIADSLPTPDGRVRSYTLVVPNSLKGRPAPVLFVRIHGGGHSVPRVTKKGHRGKFRKRLLGPTNMDLDTRKLIVDFLEL